MLFKQYAPLAFYHVGSTGQRVVSGLSRNPWHTFHILSKVYCTIITVRLLSCHFYWYLLQLNGKRKMVTMLPFLTHCIYFYTVKILRSLRPIKWWTKRIRRMASRVEMVIYTIWFHLLLLIICFRVCFMRCHIVQISSFQTYLNRERNISCYFLLFWIIIMTIFNDVVWSFLCGNTKLKSCPIKSLFLSIRICSKAIYIYLIYFPLQIRI